MSAFPLSSCPRPTLTFQAWGHRKVTARKPCQPTLGHETSALTHLFLWPAECFVPFQPSRELFGSLFCLFAYFKNNNNGNNPNQLTTSVHFLLVPKGVVLRAGSVGRAWSLHWKLLRSEAHSEPAQWLRQWLLFHLPVLVSSWGCTCPGEQDQQCLRWAHLPLRTHRGTPFSAFFLGQVFSPSKHSFSITSHNPPPHANEAWFIKMPFYLILTASHIFPHEGFIAIQTNLRSFSWPQPSFIYGAQGFLSDFSHRLEWWHLDCPLIYLTTFSGVAG